MQHTPWGPHRMCICYKLHVASFVSGSRICKYLNYPPLAALSDSALQDFVTLRISQFLGGSEFEITFYKITSLFVIVTLVERREHLKFQIFIYLVCLIEFDKKRELFLMAVIYIF